ncbi:pro-corazonin-like [Zootermopsis nevadensis]|uniref:Pro-corazonin n=1 Tax=Zootermopsis nevadensis TaxID=136037 RepID=A0A067RNA3_ZOONE|nr:pro-corazonin-like [Zootermopsis nevadensis]KDR21179.1 hypothetical protein L798_04569 [Zootermopsis nevadensis]
MHLNSTASSSRCRSRMTGLLLIFCCLTGSILAQTFQYSRGWTNGRKRSGPSPQMLIPSSASGERLFQNTDESSAISNPCSQLQRIRFLLGARNPQQFYFPCETWTDIFETPSEEVSERFRRKAHQDFAEGNNIEGN